MMENNQRRRVLNVMALSTSTLLLPASLLAKPKEMKLYKWHGNALGAETSIQLFHDDANKADQILKECASLVQKYEKVFSLFDENSEVSWLNENGIIHNASDEFIKLTNISKQYSVDTKGAFDITIQPLWNLYKEYFTGDAGSSLNEKVKASLEVVGSQNIEIKDSDISFKKDGMGISFNGIAQGYITDKVTEYLSGQGFDNTLIDIGEYRAAGPQPDGEPWRIGLMDPFDEVSISEIIEMDKGAVATSGGYGDKFDVSGKYHHIFNPHTGMSSDLYASITVKADDATTADALSTAFSNMVISDIEILINTRKNVDVRVTKHDGEVIQITSS